MRNYPQTLLDPTQCAMLIIDEQPMMFFGVENTQVNSVMNNVVGLAKTAKVFGVPTVLTTVSAPDFAGPLYSKLQAVFPKQAPALNRTTLNAWEDENVKKAVEDTGRKKLIMAGLWTEVCLAFPALCAMYDGYEVYIVTDASGSSSKQAHDMGIQRMIQAGAVPVTWEQVMLEFQRDWNDKTTYQACMDIIKEHGGPYGLAVEYKERMLP